jgi:hypothetical protein
MAGVACALALGLVTSLAWVQEADPGQRGARRQRRFDRTRMMTMRARGGGLLRDYTAGIRDLTDQQRRQIAGIRQAALAKVRELEAQMNADIKRVLTPAQAQAMEQAQRQVTHRGPGGVILTDQQKKILDDARADAAKVDDPAARAEIMRKANEQIQATYTEEQKKQAEERRARFSRFRNQGRRGGTRQRQGRGQQGQGPREQGD